jgi:hypothetical protein
LPNFTPNFGSERDWSKTIEIDNTKREDLWFKDVNGKDLSGKIKSYELGSRQIVIYYEGNAVDEGVAEINYKIPVKMKCTYNL